MAPNRNLQLLHEAGVSIWLDTLSRELLDRGGFAELIRDWAVTGATSNPTIFAKAITDSNRRVVGEVGQGSGRAGLQQRVADHPAAEP
jgi:transaldolase